MPDSWPSGTEAPEPRPRLADAWSPVSVLAFGIAAVILFYHSEHFQMIVDDAFISLRYARNWVEGKGLVFNPGERVEGYSDFLWVVLLAAAMKLKLNGLVAARFLGLGFAIGSLWLAARFSRLISGRARPGDVLAALFLSFSGAFALWAGAGLENGLFTFLVLLGQVLFLRGNEKPAFARGLGWGFLFVLATLTRPDGGLFFLAGLALRLFQLRQGNARARWQEALGASLAFAVPLGIHLLWRLSYYGEWVPNTFFVKAGTGAAQLQWGLSYAEDFVSLYSPLVLAPLLLLATLRKLEPEEIALLVFGGLYLLYVTVIGGDRVFPYFRFFMVILPNLYLLIGRGVETAGRVMAERTSSLRAGAGLGVFLVVLATLSLRASTGNDPWSVVQDNNRTREDGIKIGRWLAATYPPTTWIAMSRCGVIPYYSGLPTIDLLGLTDLHIGRASGTGLEHLPGHGKHDFRYALERQPTLIFYWDNLFARPPLQLGFSRVQPGLVGFQELADPEVRARFEREYQFQIAPIAGGFAGFFQRVQR